MLCKFKTAIYGLKQNQRAWFEKFNIVVARVGFKGVIQIIQFLFFMVLLV